MAETALRPFQVWLNVINALLLRDIRARAGKFYSGYLAVFLMPFVHLAVVLTFFVVTERAPPVGTQPIIFYGLSILPFVVFMYPSRQIVVALAANRPLLYFPRVKITDVIIARSLLEAANGMAASAMLFVVLFVATGEFSPRDPFGVVCALLLALYLGCAWGFVNALIAKLFDFWNYGFNVLFPMIWLLSGVLFYIHALPSPYRRYLSYSPILQCVEYIRYAYYEGYPNDILDVWYIVLIANCLVALGFAIERGLRRDLLSS